MEISGKLSKLVKIVKISRKRSKSTEIGRKRLKSIENDRNRSKTIEIGRKLSKSVENGGNRSKAVEIGQKRLKSAESGRNRSKSIENGRNRSKTMEIDRKRLKSVESDRNRSKMIESVETMEIARFEKNKSHNVERAETRETSEPGLVRRLLCSNARIGAASSLTVGFIQNLNRRTWIDSPWVIGNIFFCHKVLRVLVLSFKCDKVLQEVSTSRFWFKEGYLVVKFDRFEQEFHQRVFFDLFVQGLLGFNRQNIYFKRFISIQILVVLGRQVRFIFVLGFKKSDYLEYKRAQENREAKVIQESNDHAAVAQRKVKVKQLEGKTNTDCLGNVVERYKGDNNIAALGVVAMIEEYAHDSLTFKDALACEVISKWISVMKEDMDTRSSMYYIGFTCESKDEIWVTKGLLKEAKEFVLGMEIFRTQSGNTLRVSRLRFSNRMSVQILLGEHSTLSLEGGLSGNRDEEKKSGPQPEVPTLVEAAAYRKRLTIIIKLVLYSSPDDGECDMVVCCNAGVLVGYVDEDVRKPFLFSHGSWSFSLSFKGDKVLQDVLTSSFKEGYLVVKFDQFDQGFHQRVFFDLFVKGLSFLGIQVLVVLGRQVRFSFVLGFKKSDYLEYKENREPGVIQESNDHAAVAQRKLKVKQLEEKTNTNCLVNKQVHHGANVKAIIMKTGVPGQKGVEGNAAESYRGANNMAALGVAAVIKEYAHESLTFRDAVACEVIFKWISVMKEDMETWSSMCMLSNSFRRSSDDSSIYYWKYAPGMFIYLFLYIDYVRFTCESKAEIWVTKGLLDEAKEIILGMEIFRTRSGNTLRVSRFRFSNRMSVQILLGRHSTLLLKGGLSRNRDEEKKSGLKRHPVLVPLCCSMDSVKKQTMGNSNLEALPQEMLVRVLCGVQHDDLRRLFFVSKAIREAVPKGHVWIQGDNIYALMIFETLVQFLMVLFRAKFGVA
nr:zinc finger, CCHC-type [Tanacetum cinerariifolium]